MNLAQFLCLHLSPPFLGISFRLSHFLRFLVKQLFICREEDSCPQSHVQGALQHSLQEIWNQNGMIDAVQQLHIRHEDCCCPQPRAQEALRRPLIRRRSITIALNFLSSSFSRVLMRIKQPSTEQARHISAAILHSFATMGDRDHSLQKCPCTPTLQSAGPHGRIITGTPTQSAFASAHCHIHPSTSKRTRKG